jgi:hypothetical protein
MWTQFMDMHSGGGRKLDWEYIYIEAPQAEAEAVFFAKFKRNPNRVTCTCCGPDYSITESEDLAQATAFERGCGYAYFDADGTEHDEDYWYSLPREERGSVAGRYVERKSTRFSYREYVPLEDYMKFDGVHFVPASHIEPEERAARLPAEGYVWAGD